MTDPAQNASPSASQSRRWLFRGGALVAALAVALLVLGYAKVIQPKHELAQYRARLKAQGVPLTVADCTPTSTTRTADRDTGAAFIAAAQSLELSGRVLPDSAPQAMVMVAPGRAAPGWAQINPPSANFRITNSWSAVAQDLERAEPALKMIRELSGSAGLDWGFDYALGYNQPFHHLSPIRSSARWLLASVEVALREGRLEDALTDLEVQMRLLKLWEGKGLTLDQVIFANLSISAAQLTWDLLAKEGSSEAQLARMASAWAALNPVESALAGLQRDRTVMLAELERWRAQPSRVTQYLLSTATTAPGPTGGGVQFAANWIRQAVGGTANSARAYAWARFESWKDELVFLQLSQNLFDRTRQCLGPAGTPKSDSGAAFLPVLSPDEQVLAASRSLAGAGFPPLESVLRKAFQAQTLRDLVRTAVALRRYQIRHRALPDSISDLIPTFLDQSPRDWMDGAPLRYRRLGDTRFLLYSVNEDGVDDGGDPTSTVVHSKNFQPQHGRDYLWPTPVGLSETPSR